MMPSGPAATALERHLEQARELDRDGKSAQAEAAYAGIAQAWPDNAEAVSRLAQFALDRDDAPRAAQLLQHALQSHPADGQLALDLTIAYMGMEQSAQAIATLEGSLARAPGFFEGWLMLGEIREAQGDARGALKAWNQAITRAQCAGFWHDRDSTPLPLLETVLHAIDTVRRGRRELYFAAYDDLRARFGDDALKRVDKALKAYIGEQKSPPPDARQRPRFFYFPDLPPTPYFDPYLQPWAPALRDAFPVIREEALRVFAEDQRFDDFVELKGEARMQDYIGGNGPAPAWEALFFYRHGQRYDSTHERCPRTSAVLESIDLCRVEDEAPEICFSVLTPGSTILPHYGVTNTRSVMHLPLQVPPDCALNVIGLGEHHWREGELMMFDDTYQHEAWNRSSGTRIILLMDCWNPHLTEVERLAVKQLIETIGGLHRASQPLKAPRTRA